MFYCRPPGVRGPYEVQHLAPLWGHEQAGINVRSRSQTRSKINIKRRQKEPQLELELKLEPPVNDLCITSLFRSFQTTLFGSW